MPSTVHFQRVLRAPPERIYRAFTDPAAQVKWLPPYGYTCTVHAYDARVGGRFRSSFTHFASQQTHHFGGQYLELVENELLRYSDVFEDTNLPGEMVTTVRLRAVSCGTELLIEQAGIPDAIPPEMCHLGWQESLAQLALLVEPPPAP